MTVKLSAKQKTQSLDKKISQLKPKKGFQAKQFLGKIKLKEDPLAIQKRLRNEWK